MKFVIVLACLLAVAYANEDVKVLKNEAEVNPDSFHHILELDNSIRAVQHGELKDKDNWIVQGEYSFVSKEGKPHKVVYIADKDGYHPKIES